MANTHSSHLENIPTSLPAMAPELGTAQGLQRRPHRPHWPLSTWQSVMPLSPPKRTRGAPAFQFPVEVGTPPCQQPGLRRATQTPPLLIPLPD